MILQMLGTDTSKVEVSNVSKHGIWLLVRDKEFFCHLKISLGLRINRFQQFLM